MGPQSVKLMLFETDPGPRGVLVDVSSARFEAYLGRFDSPNHLEEALKVNCTGTKKGWKMARKCIFPIGPWDHYLKCYIACF